MKVFDKYYQKEWAERLDILATEMLSKDDSETLKKMARTPEIGDTMIENYVTDFTLPEGLALNYVVNEKEYVIPMVVEEPSVIAASCNAAGIVKKAGGFHAEVTRRQMIGQVIMENVRDVVSLSGSLQSHADQLVKVANAAHPSLQKRGGGARDVRVRALDNDLVSLDLIVDTQEAMGANMMNTMLEAVATYIRQQFDQDVLMSILSNYATQCLVTATCRIPVDLLTKRQIKGDQAAMKIAAASRVAQLDPYRAVTHNKGIMNGVDAVVIATGNDWRAIEGAAHAYASRDGHYRGLSTWEVVDNELCGRITLPMPVGTVGGSIKIVPLVKINHQLLRVNNARELMTVIAAVGLGQNLAALYALVTEGIQRGHMRLQLKSLARSVGATDAEIPAVVARMTAQNTRDSAGAQAALKWVRAHA